MRTVLSTTFKRLRGLKNYPYADRLKLLNLSSLELRRIHSDLAWCYKIVFGLTILKFDDFCQWNTAPQTRGYPYRLYKTNSTRRARTVFSQNGLSMSGTICQVHEFWLTAVVHA